MHRKKKISLKKILYFLLCIILLAYLAVKGWEWYALSRQLEEASRIRDQLQQENQELENQKAALEDPAVIEKKAREDLGLVKQGEVPYVR